MSRRASVVFVAFAASTVLVVVLPAATIVGGEYFLRYWYRDITTTSENSSWFARHWYLELAGKSLIFRNHITCPAFTKSTRFGTMPEFGFAVA